MLSMTSLLSLLAAAVVETLEAVLPLCMNLLIIIVFASDGQNVFKLMTRSP